MFLQANKQGLVVLESAGLQLSQKNVILEASSLTSCESTVGGSCCGSGGFSVGRTV